MVRREQIPARGVDLNLPVASDWLMWIEILINSGGEIRYINSVLGKYRRHGRNVTNDAKHGSLSRGVRDHLATCMKILYLHPEYSRQVLFRLATILRGLRHSRGYVDSLVGSLRCSVQLKTIAIFVVYIASFGTLKI